MNFLKKAKSSTSISADVIDEHLILSLPNAQDPIVWRMALDKIGTASFEVKTNKDNDQAKLVLKPKKGTAEAIATFTNKSEALDALVAASNALQNSSQKTKTVTDNIKSKVIKVQKNDDKGNNNQWSIALIGALLVIGLYYYLTILIPKEATIANTQTSQNINSVTPSSNVGKPISADDFLSEF